MRDGQNASTSAEIFELISALANDVIKKPLIHRVFPA